MDRINRLLALSVFLPSALGHEVTHYLVGRALGLDVSISLYPRPKWSLDLGEGGICLRGRVMALAPTLVGLVGLVLIIQADVEMIVSPAVTIYLGLSYGIYLLPSKNDLYWAFQLE
ncbi:MAG: hypothetical protein SV253_01180 [Halobacteria archaeon]|nr:hypothetical protein [Halobacteria archaeon]